jgi:hypothetical protein
VPTALLRESEERWLGITVEGQEEGARLLLVSVPYALHAEEAERLAGKLPSEFVSVEQLRAEVERAVMQRGSVTPMATAGVTAESTAGINLGPTTFAGTTTDEIVLVQQSGTGYALRATGSGTAAAVFGESNGTAPAILGAATANSGTATGVQGSSQSANGTGVRGQADTTTGSGIGVWGVSRGPGGPGVVGGTGVLGEAASPTGAVFGVRGKASSPNGIALFGQETATTGPAIGVLGESRSLDGVAGAFTNSAGGKILSGMNNWTEKFRVGGNGDIFSAGNVTATDFFGNGSNLTGIGKLTTNIFTGAQTAPSFTASTSLAASTNLSLNGQFVVMPDSQDTVHSFTKQSGDQMHIRLSRAVPDEIGGKHFMITPYKYGTAIEYAGVIEVWSKAFSVHGYGPDTPNFWITDDFDMGGLYATARQQPPGNGYVRFVAQKFDLTSHGSFNFAVRNLEDAFLFTSGPDQAERRLAEIGQWQTPYIQATAVQVRAPSVVTALEADELGGRGLVGTRTNHLLDFIVGDQTSQPAMRLFANGNLSLGSNFDRGTKLAVGTDGGFQVADSGAVTIGTTGTPITRHISAQENLAFGSLALGECAVANVTVSGAEDGDTVAIGVPQQMAGIPGLMYFGWVSALDTVSVRACNIAYSGGTVGVPAGQVRADVWKH